jgi:hypothetical protein
MFALGLVKAECFVGHVVSPLLQCLNAIHAGWVIAYRSTIYFRGRGNNLPKVLKKYWKNTGKGGFLDKIVVKSTDSLSRGKIDDML